MDIKIPVELVKRIGIKKFTLLNVSEDDLNWSRSLSVDLNDIDVKEVEKLQEICSKNTDIPRIKSLMWDMKIWLTSKKNPDSVIVRKLTHFESLLIAYVRKIPNQWLLEKLGKDINVMLAHYVSNIEYHPPKKSRDYFHPAYVIVETAYEKYGKKMEESFTFRESDVSGKHIADILVSQNLFPANEEFVKNHNKEISRYAELIPLIGKQFTVHGVATDDAPGEKKSWWDKKHVFTFSDDRRKNRVVIDSFQKFDNEEEEDNNKEPYIDRTFWSRNNPKKSREEDFEENQGEEDEVVEVQIPIHPFLVVFDMFRHLRLSVHVNFLTEYIYDKDLASKLILPDEIKSLITMLVEHKEGNFKDIVAGKGGGAIVLLTGAPGVGKTLTAEVFAEADKKPLYSVQASQLGTSAEELEKNLMVVLQRAARWNAIMLLDEADVYVHERGSDLEQNAIVGVFLRVLEYHASILFLTTNRPDLVDDAIASRCIARIDYKYPDKKEQKRIWRVLADSSSMKLPDSEITKFVEKNTHVSGRDVKNLLKLAGLIASAQKKPITAKLLEYVLKFKPTTEKRG